MEAEAASEDESSTMSGELSEVECKNQDDAESLKRRLNKVSSELEAACDKLTRLERKLQAYLYEEEAFHNDDEMVVPTSGCANQWLCQQDCWARSNVVWSLWFHTSYRSYRVIILSTLALCNDSFPDLMR